MVNPTCANLSMRVSRLSCYPWDSRLDNLGKHLFWLPTPTSSTSPPLITTVLYLSRASHAYHVRKLLPRLCRYHPTIKHSSLHLHLHHMNMHTNYKKRSVMEINRAMWSLLCELMVETYIKLLMLAIMWCFEFIRNSFLLELLRCCMSAVLNLSRS